MKELHGLFDEQTGMKIPGAYTYAEIGRITGRSLSTVSQADDSGFLIAGRWMVLPDPFYEEWDAARESFASCRKSMEKILNARAEDKPLPMGQLSLSDLFE